MKILSSFLNVLAQLVVVGTVTLSATFFIVLNRFKEEIWEVLEFEEKREQ